MGLQPGTDFGMLLRVARLFRSWRVDVVHTRNVESFFYGLPAARLAGVPAVIHSEHGRTFPEKRLRVIVQRLLLRHADAAFTVSEQLRADLVRELRLRSDRLDVLYNGVDIARFHPAVRSASCEGTRPLRIGSVGRLVPVKNYPLLLKAFASLPANVPTELVLVGEGPERAALEQLASELGIRARVKFAGHRNDVPQVLQGLDIFVLPSINEGMSNTLLEAMAAGLPVVASDVGGNREIVQDERSGLLFRSGDAEGAASRLLRLAKGADLRHGLGQAAAARVREHFSMEAMLRRYEALYRGVWEERHREPAAQASL